MEWIDTHAHLPHIAERGVSVEPFLDGTEIAVIDIGTLPDDLEPRLAMKNGRKGRIAFTAGLYPATVLRHRSEICGIGEFGLDFYCEGYGSPEKQTALARKQIELAAELGLPVVIHSRNADEEIIRLFSDYAPVRGVIHCFSSGPETAEKLLDYGFFLSFCGNLTYKNSRAIQEAARAVPLDRMVFETDSPYLAPVPVRGTVNTPANVEHVYRFFSELRGIPLPEIQPIFDD